ncbi:MAG: TlpA family protein disulfide reductase [Candidatus Rokubacteria bacterium]|nr:TlpA family protein disulfide reductase [Candidatus Rokubacteria bacterium]
MIVGALTLLLGALAGPASARDPAFSAMAVTHDPREDEAPDFTLATPVGQRVRLADLRGQAVLLNFWATWCPPCRLEMPAMERLYREFRDQGFVILAVDLDESPKLVAKFMSDFRLSFPAPIDPGSRVAALYRVPGVPTTFLIDRRGRMLGVAVGPREWATPEGRTLIRGLLDRR